MDKFKETRIRNIYKHKDITDVYFKKTVVGYVLLDNDENNRVKVQLKDLDDIGKFKCGLVDAFSKPGVNVINPSDDYNDMFRKFEAWGKERNIIGALDYTPEKVFKQYAKVNEEVGELGKALLLNDKDQVDDALGDAVMTLTLLARMVGSSLHQGMKRAWQDLDGREGETINNTYVKKEDLLKVKK